MTLLNWNTILIYSSAINRKKGELISTCTCVFPPAQTILVQSKLLLSALPMRYPFARGPQHWQRRRMKSFSSRSFFQRLLKDAFKVSLLGNFSPQSTQATADTLAQTRADTCSKTHFQVSFQWSEEKKAMSTNRERKYKRARLKWMGWGGGRGVKLQRCCLLCHQTIRGHTRIGLHETWGAVECAEHWREAGGKQWAADSEGTDTISECLSWDQLHHIL